MAQGLDILTWSDTSRAFTETDMTSRLQFFDLFLADTCEVESLRDYPPRNP